VLYEINEKYIGLMVMILVAITCTSQDFKLNCNRLSKSISNFYSCFGVDVFFLIVYQSKEISDLVIEKVKEIIPEENGEVVGVTYLSVSKARNDALNYARMNKFDHIIFHDSTIIYAAGYLSWLKENLGARLLSTNFQFTTECETSLINDKSEVVKFNAFDDIYVCSYVFSLKNKFPIFDERFGPGESSIYTSGEDFLFLRSFFKNNPECRFFLRYKGTGILHPPRPLDYSKHLAYAEGQGKIHQVFLGQEKSIYAIWRCCLFFGNALLRVVLLKKHSLKILGLRLKGFFDTKVKV
jgi:hypothetical protein